MLARLLAFFAPVLGLLVLIPLLLSESVIAVHNPHPNGLATPLHFLNGFWPHFGRPAPPPMPGPTPRFAADTGSHANRANKTKLRTPSAYFDNAESTTPPWKPPAVKRDVNTIPDTWYIQRAYQGENFFK